MSIALTTATRDRHEQLGLVVDCINNQTLKPDIWVIVDDGKEQLPKDLLDRIKVPFHYIHWKSGLKTSTSMNCAVALENARADKYIFIDDDDYYPPVYVERFAALQDKDEEMVGNKRWIDYRLSTAHYRIRIKSDKQIESGDTLLEWHGSGIRGERLKQDIISVLKKTPEDRYPDCRCCDKLFRTGKYPCMSLDFGEWGATSMKDYGVGTPGVIESHRSDSGLVPDDKDLSFLKSRLGDDWVRYKKYIKRKI